MTTDEMTRMQRRIFESEKKEGHHLRGLSSRPLSELNQLMEKEREWKDWAEAQARLSAEKIRYIQCAIDMKGPLP